MEKKKVTEEEELIIRVLYHSLKRQGLNMDEIKDVVTCLTTFSTKEVWMWYLGWIEEENPSREEIMGKIARELKSYYARLRNKEGGRG